MNNFPPRPSLPKSYKRKFPFRLCAPSFIYPDDYAVNVGLLGPYLDEIELLFFESDMDSSLPSPSVIRELRDLSERFHLSYNIHLPIDIDPGSADPGTRNQAVACIRHICDLTRPLSPSTYTIHLPADEAWIENRDLLDTWRTNVIGSLVRIIGREYSSRLFSVETLHYPMEWIAPVVRKLDLSVCFDVGHQLVDGLNIESFFGTYWERISVVHLHGVENRKDHIGLNRLPRETLVRIVRMLKHFSGTVSIEVFSYSHLKDSLQIFEEIWSVENQGQPCRVEERTRSGMPFT